MKNLIYAGVIGVCIVVALVVFLSTRDGGSGIESLDDSEMTWVKCFKCGAGYEMSLKEYYQQVKEKGAANPSPIPVTLPLTCQKCGQDAVVKAFKCEKCGEVSKLNSVPADYEDRCPKCKHSAIEASRQKRLQQQP
jgi:predicted Zn-ribbon and HTH transcriptional regulator